MQQLYYSSPDNARDRDSAALAEALQLYPDYLAAARNGTALEVAHATMQRLRLDTSWQLLDLPLPGAEPHGGCERSTLQTVHVRHHSIAKRPMPEGMTSGSEAADARHHVDVVPVRAMRPY